ncbi:MAG: hypothetical protein NC035_08920 [Bacteroides sp.]|nr:hypothetical protein [Bacteroides sp.]
MENKIRRIDTTHWWFMKQARAINAPTIAKFLYKQYGNALYRLYAGLLYKIKDYAKTNDHESVILMHDYIVTLMLQDIYVDFGEEVYATVNKYIFRYNG